MPASFATRVPADQKVRRFDGMGALTAKVRVRRPSQMDPLLKTSSLRAERGRQKRSGPLSRTSDVLTLRDAFPTTDPPFFISGAHHIRQTSSTWMRGLSVTTAIYRCSRADERPSRRAGLGPRPTATLVPIPRCRPAVGYCPRGGERTARQHRIQPRHRRHVSLDRRIHPVRVADAASCEQS